MGVLDQAGKAAEAAVTASFNSCGEDIGTVDKSTPSTGEITSSKRVVLDATKLPLMKFWTGWYFMQPV
jgi:hypothetical protein